MTEEAFPYSSHSRFVQRIQRRYAELLPLLPSPPATDFALKETWQALLAQALDFGSSLRVLRQLTLLRWAQADLDHEATLQTVTQGMTDLAEFCIQTAMTHAQAELIERYGTPLGATGQAQPLWALGMGKLGAWELNVSSDIDLIFLYQEDGFTEGVVNAEGERKGIIAASEFFEKLVRSVSTLLGDITEHGFVFRVDLALRPNGNSGPAAISLNALDTYFQVQGREWERFAWLKSRIVAATQNGREPELAKTVRAVVLPFVFRRYLDYAVFESLRILHQQIKNHANKRSAGHPERANDIKLSRGGIREIEFIVQLLQVVRGGQFPELRSRATLRALPNLAKADLIPQQKAQGLAQAYLFLRRLEHRIQYLDDRQTHILPSNESDLDWIANSLGFDNRKEFLACLEQHRNVVADEFEQLLGDPQAQTNAHSHSNATTTPDDPCHDAQTETFLSALDWEDFSEQIALPTNLNESVRHLGNNPRIQALSDKGRERLMRLIVRTGQAITDDKISELAAQRWMEWVETLLGRESYLALLLERPGVHRRLLRLLGAAKWPLRFLLQHPGTIDELANDSISQERFDPQQLLQELDNRRRSLQATQEDDEESLLNVLRRAHHAELLRTLVRDVEGSLSVEQVADDLSALADTILEVTCRWCWEGFAKKHRPQPQFAIIGYGKLGGKELGYGSDLDIVFVFDDSHEDALEIYTAYVRKLINWLSVKTAEGDLFEIDTALRPNGNSGLLVTSFNAYAKYQERNDSNTAWTWEHQAITRARFVTGIPSLSTRFDAVRDAVLTAVRDPILLKEEIVSMRAKVQTAHHVLADLMDLKYSRGGMVDAEFLVQYLVLLHSCTQAVLLENKGNIALLQTAEKLGLLPPQVGKAAASAYRHLRALQHSLRLNEERTQVAIDRVVCAQQAIAAAWDCVLGDSHTKGPTK